MRSSGNSALLFAAVTLPKLLDLVTALNGSFGRSDKTAAASDCIRDFLPVRSFEVSAAEGVPFLVVGFD